MATSTAATLGVSTPTHRPPGRHTGFRQLCEDARYERPVAGRYAAGGRAPRARPWGVVEAATTPCIRARPRNVSLESYAWP
eukprot:3914744-Pleurochrysis_carterae.AAC.1